MDEELNQLSERQKNYAVDAIASDNGFHNTYLLSMAPFIAMISETDSGSIVVSQSAMAEVSDSASSYTIRVWRSDEQKCWFFLVITGTDEIRGVLHFNTIYNAKGETSIMFLNDAEMELPEEVTEETKSEWVKKITQNIAYSNILVMRK